MANDMLVKTVDLTRTYEGVVQALVGVNLVISEGEFAAVMGPSGSGKSTLLNLLGALDRPTAGEVYFAGEPLSTVRDLDAFRNRSVGLVFQMHNLIPGLTAVENVEVPMMAGRLGRATRRRRAQELLALVELQDRADHVPASLSGGERQRVAIARALANEPRLLLADEPTGNLDSVSGGEVMALLQRLNQEQGMTVLVVTHDPAAARAAARIIVLHDGRVVRDQPMADPYVEDLREFRATPLGQALLQGRVPEAVAGCGLEPLLPGLQAVLSGVNERGQAVEPGGVQ